MENMITPSAMAAALQEVLAVGDSAGRRAILPDVARRHLGVEGVRVTDTLPDGQPGVPLGLGWWLVIDGGTGPIPEPLVAFAAAVGAALAFALKAEKTARDHNEVLARLDQLHRELDLAQRNEWVATERTRIAQDLHDRVAQTLFGVGLKADWLLTHLDRDEHLRLDLERVKQLASQGLRQVREAIFSLSSAPVDAKQFKAAVQGLLNDLSAAEIAGDLRTWGDVQRLPQEVVEALFQVIREALVNVRRHSDASTVLVSLRVDDEGATAVIQDDGRGLPEGVLETFRHSGAHLGLRGMENRISRLDGSLTLAPGDECGLVVTAHIPISTIEGKRRHE